MKKNMRLSLVIALIFYSSLLNGQSSQNLSEFFKYDPALEHKTDKVFHTLNDTQRVAQMIITSAGELGKDNTTVKRLAAENKIGGVCFLKGTKASHQQLITELNAIAAGKNQLPLLYSIDAEPSLFNGRIQGTPKMMNTIDIKTTAQSDSVAGIINKELLQLGIRQNFAPVVDISPDNEAIKNRSYGRDKTKVIELSKAFIKATQEDGIIATAKHFPGHGLVKGDTHKQSVYIDGELKEVDIYRPLIDAGVVSIMVAHITIKNNSKYDTEGLPATCSRKIVTGLLKEEMGFKGLVITDAMNIMKAVTYLDDAPLKASMAGCDMILMPVDEGRAISMILAEMEKNENYREQVYESVKKIIRLKASLGLI